MTRIVGLMNPILAETQTVIVYRSKTEQMQDEAAQQFMAEHATGVYYGFLGFFGLIACFILWTFCKVIGSHFRSKKSLYGRSRW